MTSPWRSIATCIPPTWIPLTSRHQFRGRDVAVSLPENGAEKRRDRTGQSLGPSGPIPRTDRAWRRVSSWIVHAGGRRPCCQCIRTYARCRMLRVLPIRDVTIADTLGSHDLRSCRRGLGPPITRRGRSGRRGPRGAVLAPCPAMLAATMLACVLVLGICGNSPVDAERMGRVIDVLLAETLDAWLETDTLTLPGIRPEDLPLHDFLSSRMMPWGPVSPRLDRVWITIEAPRRGTTAAVELPPVEGGPPPPEP